MDARHSAAYTGPGNFTVKSLLGVLITVPAAILAPLACWGQSASIAGKVIGRDGQPVAGARIKIDREGIRGHYGTKTDKTGYYVVVGLPVGSLYQVTAEIAGEEPKAFSGIRAVLNSFSKVNFNFQRGLIGAGSPEEQAALLAALRDLHDQDPQKVEQAVKKVERFADRKLPLAMYLLAKWSEEGSMVPKDTEKALALLSKAAEARYGPATYEVGKMYLEGTRFPKDEAKGLQMIRTAAVQGSVQAQFHMGASYEAGLDLPKDAVHARQYFRMCATQGEAECQYRIGLLLLNRPRRDERDYLQAMAWMQLAADQHLEKAGAILDRERPKLTAEQVQWVARLKSQFAGDN